MSYMVEECSKDGKEWIEFARFPILDFPNIFIPSKEYFEQFLQVLVGYKYWRMTKVKAEVKKMDDATTIDLWGELVKVTDEIMTAAKDYVASKNLPEPVTDEFKVGLCIKFILKLGAIADAHPHIFKDPANKVVV